MKSSEIRIAWRAVAVTCTLMLAGCAADRIRDDAQALAKQGDYEHAVAVLEVGVKQYPDSVQLRSRLLLSRSQALNQLVAQAQSAQDQGQYDAAQQLLERARPFDVEGRRVDGLLADLQVARRQAAALARAGGLASAGQVDAALKLVDDALKDNRRHAGLLALQRRLAIDQRQAQVRASQQGLAETRPVTLDFRDANVRTVLDVVSRNSGINFVLDKDVRDQRITVYAKSVRFEDALEMVLAAGQLARKVLDAKTVLVYPNTPEKQHEHQEQIVKVFYLANGDPKGAATFLKSMMKLREPYVDERDNMLALHDSLENIQLAERLIALYDNPEPEVMIEAEVLEVSADRLTDLGISPPTQVTLSVQAGGSGSSGLTLGSFPLHRADIGVSGLAATLNANHTESDVQTLANPRLRTRSHQKAKVLIGDKVPIVTTTTTPGVAGFVSESVSYQDVGIKLEVEPVVFPDDDVSINLTLEVSALGTQTKTASGTIAYQISTRDASSLLRLHDGETQLLAGLISSDERSSTAGLPGLSDVPLLGRMFSDQSHNRTKTELVLGITPHIVRGQPHLDAAAAEAWVGTDVYQRLKPVGGRFDLSGADAAPAQTGASATPARAVAVPPAQAPAAAVPPAATSAVTVPAAAAVPVGASGAAAPAAPVAAGTPAAIEWTVPATAKAGEVFDVPVRLRAGVAVGTLALRLRYPNQSLGLVGFASEAELPEAAPQGSPAVHAEPDGVGVLELQRAVPNASPGPVSLVRVQFKALKDGDATLALDAAPADPAVTVNVPAAAHLRIQP